VNKLVKLGAATLFATLAWSKGVDARRDCGGAWPSCQDYFNGGCVGSPEQCWVSSDNEGDAELNCALYAGLCSFSTHVVSDECYYYCTIE